MPQAQSLPPPDSEPLSLEVQEVAFRVARNLVDGQPLRSNSERFVDFPSDEYSLEATDSSGHTVFAMKTVVAAKEYECGHCERTIPANVEHVATVTLQESKKYDHHHRHSTCFTFHLLDNWRDVSVISASETSGDGISKRWKQQFMTEKLTASSDEEAEEVRVLDFMLPGLWTFKDGSRREVK